MVRFVLAPPPPMLSHAIEIEVTGVAWAAQRAINVVLATVDGSQKMSGGILASSSGIGVFRNSSQPSEKRNVMLVVSTRVGRRGKSAHLSYSATGK